MLLTLGIGLSPRKPVNDSYLVRQESHDWLPVLGCVHSQIIEHVTDVVHADGNSGSFACGLVVLFQGFGGWRPSVSIHEPAIHITGGSAVASAKALCRLA